MQSRKLSLGLSAGALAVAVVLFVVLRDDGGSGSASTTAGASPTTIAFQNGGPVGGVREITVSRGDRVRIDVTPDVPAEVHVHGYEFEKDVKAGETARFDFPATAEGVFEVEVHHLVGGQEQAGVQVAELRMTP